MDLGLTTGNAVFIDTPLWVHSEVDLYLYLMFNQKARDSLLQQAAKVRTKEGSDVWAHHETLWFPFVLYPTTTEMALRENARERLVIAMREGPRF